MQKKSILLVLVSGLVMLGFANLLFQFPIGFMHSNETEPVMFDLKPGSDYASDWAKVDSLDRKSLPQSALEIVTQIYEKAKREQNQAQIMKSLIYTMKYTYAVEDTALVTNLGRLEKEVAAAPFPLKPLMHSILAEHYSGYFFQNFWRFQGRTETAGLDETDISNWDSKKITKKAAEHYRLSLAAPDSLRRVRLDYFDAIIEKGDKSRLYRPSLYDLLAWRAFDFFNNDQSSLDQPAYKFQLTGDDAFLDAAAFAKAAFPTKDSSSHLLQALHILQELTRQHLYDNDPSARVFVDLARLDFARTRAINDLKDSLYLQSLRRIDQNNKTHEVSTYVLYRMAAFHYDLSGNYDGAKGDDYKQERGKALAISREAIKRFPKADGTRGCLQMEAMVLAKSMELSLEEVNQPGKPFLGSLRYANVEKVHFRAIAYTKKMRDYLSDYEDHDRYKKLAKEPFVKTWSIDLPKDDDHNSHIVEVPMQDLPVGSWVILVGTDPAFGHDKQGLAYALTQCSNIGFVDRDLGGSGVEIVAFHRETGAPLAGAQLETYENYYDYDTRKYSERPGPKGTTDKNGFVRINVPVGTSKSYSGKLSYKGDLLVIDDEWYAYGYRKEEERTYKQTYFFTDRGIYRPGQTVYFKGILLQRKGESATILTNTNTDVVFYDANGKEVAKQTLKSNAFGSIQGTFTAPQGQLNGNMRIDDSHGQAYFSVEDYKRPKFEVAFDPVKESYKLGDKVKAKGKAVAYAGSNIDGAEVRYRVVREAYFPWWSYWCWWRAMPRTNPMEIAFGTTTTNEKGEFEIEFEAIPDRSIGADLKPQFSYRIEADVVDITGETHSATGDVQVGYIGMSASVGMGGELDKEGKHRFPIHTLNLNGQPEPAKGSIVIHQLKQPEGIYRSRKWSRPDKHVIPEAEFRASFPHDLYKQEDDRTTWAKGGQVFSGTFDTEKGDTLDLGACKGWPQGAYLLELTSKDKFGSDVKWTHYFTLAGASDAGIPTRDWFWTKADKMRCEPGESAAWRIGTADEDIWVLYEVEHNGVFKSHEWIKIPRGKRNFTLPVAEEHRGGLSFHIVSARHGRVIASTSFIDVPWTNKKLDIAYATFRDKLLPGAKEEWTVKVSGPKGEKVAAELLTGMYDASLDVFRSVNWSMGLNPTHYSRYYWSSRRCNGYAGSMMITENWNFIPSAYLQEYDAIKYFDYPIYNLEWGMYDRYYEGDMTGAYDDFGGGEDFAEESIDAPNEPAAKPTPAPVMAEKSVGGALEQRAANGKDAVATKNAEASGEMQNNQEGLGASPGLGDVKVRTNLNETAFFFPQLATDSEGNVVFKFTMPEALTRWRFMTFAHTQDLKVGYKEGSLVTQKEIMVMPNAPRFFRENDQVVYMAKVSNTSDRDLDGQATLELLDAITMKPIDAQLGNVQPLKTFQVKKGQSVALSWPLRIPAGVQAVVHRVKAVAGSFSDGEESALPVLTNSMLVTEALPLPIRAKQTKTFDFTRMSSNKSNTLRHHKLTLEFTSNPAWYAVQALPYMMEYPYECTEQTFSRYYANSIASHIANSHPRIKAVFDQWRNAGKEALLSNLEKNQELKYLLLEETPWVMEAGDEAARKQRVGLLFDLNRMADELARAKQKIIKAQVSNGGFTWFPGMPDSRYITQHIVCGFGHLDRLGVEDVKKDDEVRSMLARAVSYLDARIDEDYRWLKSHSSNMDLQHIGNDQVHYLYARSFFKDQSVESRHQEAVAYYYGQAKKFWTTFNKYNQGMIALAMHRGQDGPVAADIVKSLREHALQSEEMGMYWKKAGEGLYWYEAPVETQALMIEVFDEVAGDAKAVDELKLWLLKQKQTQDWKTTKATAEACYALLLQGSDYLAESGIAEVSVGGQRVDPGANPSLKAEAGTGYFKTSWTGSEIKPEMAKVKVTNPNGVAAWGALYWQYFEQLDKITWADNKVSIQKALFLEENTPTGPKITPITGSRPLKPGDKVKVRILISTDRDMEYVHIKDMRASGFEPIDVISRYRWQDGLGYYESTRDAATNFFIDWLPKGKYVFEYPLRATHQGDFSNGITTIQCMYAPEFTSHSEGVRVKIGG